jgi:hypothetical protein
MSNPLSLPGYDVVELAGQTTPGIATIEGADSPRRIVERRGFGNTGATARAAGRELSKFKLYLDLYTPEHFEAWTAFLPVLEPPAPEAPTSLFALPRTRALDIAHPFLEDLGIRSVLIRNVKQPKKMDGFYRVEIELHEYRAPRPALAAVDGSDTRPESPEERELREALSENAMARRAFEEAST